MGWRLGKLCGVVLLGLGCTSSAPSSSGQSPAVVDGGSGRDAGASDAGSPDGADGGVPDAGIPDPGARFKTIRWSEVQRRPEGTSEAHGAFVGGKLYTFGGFDWIKDCCTPTRHAYVYDPATNRWAQLADMPEGVSHAGTATDGTDIYWAGGYVEDPPRTFQIFGTVHVWRYRVATNSYESMPELPVRRGAGAMEYLDGELHFFGGLTQGQAADAPEHWVLDVLGGATTWTPAAPLPIARNHLGSAVLGGQIYAVGGQHGHDEALVVTTAVHSYDPATDQWTRREDIPHARSHIAQGTFVFRGRILVLGGEVRNGIFTDESAAYDPATDSWAELTPLPVKRHSGIARSFGAGFIYTTGEYSDQTFLGTPAD